MNLRKLLVGSGVAITTFVLVATLGVDLLTPVLEATTAAELVSIALGIVLAIAAGALVSFKAALLSRMAWASLVAYAAFGVTYLAIWSAVMLGTVSDVAVNGAVHLGSSLVVALLVAAIYLRRRSRKRVAAA